MTNNYNVDYFIKMFQAIPEDLWCIHARAEGDKRCAYGWCYPTAEQAKMTERGSMRANEKEIALTQLLTSALGSRFMAGGINNGVHEEYQQPTPKQRILAALEDVKKLQHKEPRLVIKEVIRYVAVPEKVRKRAKELVSLN